LIITDRGVPIARLEALDETPPPESIRSLVERGLVRYRRPGGDEPGPPILLKPGGGSAVDFVIEQRR
jgi:antitoxin (DNA-binding transcriptional repressor) of toxin-antitoxin stability system